MKPKRRKIALLPKLPKPPDLQEVVVQVVEEGIVEVVEAVEVEEVAEVDPVVVPAPLPRAFLRGHPGAVEAPATAFEMN